TREPSQGRVDALDEDSVVTIGRRRTRQIDPTRRRRRAWRAAVVNRVPAVTAPHAVAHLRYPRPDVFRWRIDRNRVGRREKWVGHEDVGGKRTMPFGGGREAGCERHNTIE